MDKIKETKDIFLPRVSMALHLEGMSGKIQQSLLEHTIEINKQIEKQIQDFDIEKFIKTEIDKQIKLGLMQMMREIINDETYKIKLNKEKAIKGKIDEWIKENLNNRGNLKEG